MHKLLFDKATSI